MRRLSPAIVLLPGLLAAGCATEPKEVPITQQDTPLAFDPTEEHQLATWWTNGRHLLQLADDGSYALHAGTNRYHQPDERGRWWRQSYAAMYLEPYAQLRHEMRRVAIGKEAGQLVLHVPGLEPMHPLERPPEVLEDLLIGLWQGDAGQLVLHDTLRYVFSPHREGPPEPASLSGHRGRWHVAGDAIHLEPDSPKAMPMVLPLRRSDEELLLQSAGGSLHRATGP